MMKRFLRLTRTSTQSGQAIVIVALTMSAMLVLAVLALDGGRFYTQRRTSQNASDIASLGAIHPFLQAGNRIGFSGTVLGKDITDDVVFTQIVQFAQANGIPDTDNNPSNGINENVQAWWLDSSGNQILFAGNPVKIVDAPQFPPPGANGIEVRTRIPYQTFIGGLVHQESLTAQADGTARVVWSNKPITGITDQAVWVGGGADCNNLTDRIAHNYAQTNTAYFGGSTYVNGSLAVGAVQATHFNGDVSVSGPVGIGPADGIPTPYTTFTNLPPYNHSNKDPFETASGSNNFDTGSFHPGASPLGMSPVVQITKTVNPDGTFTNLATPRLLEASDFDPSVPGEMYKRYLYVYQPLGLAPANFFHTIQGDDGITPGYAALQVDNLVNSSQ